MGNVNLLANASVVDANPTTTALTGNNTKLIKYYSNAYAKMEFMDGAVIDLDMCIIRNGHQTGYGTSHTFNNVENNVFEFSAEDDKGNIDEIVMGVLMVDYIKPTCNLTNTRIDANGNFSVWCSGNYFNGSFGAVANTLSVQYRYKTTTGSYGNWQTMTITKNGNYYGATATGTIPNFDYKSIYVFQCQATDKLATVASVSTPTTSTPVFHWGKNDFTFEVPFTSCGGDTIGGDLNITGDLRLKNSGVYGNTLRFGDGDYCYLSEKKDDELTIHTEKSISLEAPHIYINGSEASFASGTWTPRLGSAVSSYTTQQGWWSRVGNTVTMGFFVKATCASGWHSSRVEIWDGSSIFTYYGFYPQSSVAFGGMCSGVYVSAGFNFQCFVLDTSGKITTRVQACNNTSEANLATSASGCGYPYGGGEITLSGTVTFTV